jgi:hypothetical protein
MKHTRVLLVAIAAAFGAAGVAHAAIHDWNAYWVDSSPFNLANTYWDFTGDGTTGNPYVWDVTEDYIAPTLDQSISWCDGTADADPTIEVRKAIKNDSTFEWTDYHVVIWGSPGVSYVPGSATSDTFGTIVESPGGVIDFYAPATVPIGGVLRISFDIVIPPSAFWFDISQMPTPEPSALALLGFGALAVLRRKP